MIIKKFIIIIISLGLYGLNSHAMDLANQKRDQEDQNEVRDTIDSFRHAEAVMDHIIDRHQREMREELVEMITTTEAELALTTDQKEREELIDATTHFLARETSYAPALALWLKGSGNPNNIASISTISPLFQAIQACNIEGIKILLADPRTIISNRELFLQVAIANGSAEIDQTNKYKKIIHLLLFFGVDPHAKIGKNLTGQETAEAFESYDPEYTQLTKNHRNVAVLLSQEERAELGKVMRDRKRLTHAALIHREIGVRPAKMGKKVLLPKADHPQQTAIAVQPNDRSAAGAGAAQAPLVTFNWPKIDDNKNNK